MNIRIVAILVGAILFSVIYNGLSGDWRTDSLLTSSIKFIGAALIMGVAMHFSMKRLRR
jgi:hypothetical protein